MATRGIVAKINIKIIALKKFVTKRVLLVAASSNLQACWCSLPGIVGSKYPGGHVCLSRVNVLCCQVEASEMN